MFIKGRHWFGFEALRMNQMCPGQGSHLPNRSRERHAQHTQVRVGSRIPIPRRNSPQDHDYMIRSPLLIGFCLVQIDKLQCHSACLGLTAWGGCLECRVPRSTGVRARRKQGWGRWVGADGHSWCLSQRLKGSHSTASQMEGKANP